MKRKEISEDEKLQLLLETNSLIKKLKTENVLVLMSYYLLKKSYQI